MAASITGREYQVGIDEQRMPVAVPPAYPDPETWRQFGIFRRQLQRADRHTRRQVLVQVRKRS